MGLQKKNKPPAHKKEVKKPKEEDELDVSGLVDKEKLKKSDELVRKYNQSKGE